MDPLSWIETRVWAFQVPKRWWCLPFLVRFLLPHLRRMMKALRAFLEDQGQLKAAALTFFTFFSLPSILAVAFGLAKGFHLEQQVEKMLRSSLEAQPQVCDFLVEHGTKALDNTKGGLLAGVGVAVLLWSFVKVVGSIEGVFNDIWHVRRPRSLLQKFTDYSSALVICTILLALSSSISVLVTTYLHAWENDYLAGFSGVAKIAFGSLIWTLATATGMLAMWVAFSFVFIFIPNTRVTTASGVYAGVVTGTLFFLLQFGFVFAQVNLMKGTNQVYGSFAALPLFLMWLQLSWTLIIYGAELSHVHHDGDDPAIPPVKEPPAIRTRQLLALAVCQMVVKTFCREHRGIGAREISRRLGVATSLVRDVVSDLIHAGILIETASAPGGATPLIPLIPPDELTVMEVISRMGMEGLNLAIDDSASPEIKAPAAVLADGMKLFADATSKKLIRDL
jgi:membrane protein